MYNMDALLNISHVFCISLPVHFLGPAGAFQSCFSGKSVPGEESESGKSVPGEESEPSCKLEFEGEEVTFPSDSENESETAYKVETEGEEVTLPSESEKVNISAKWKLMEQTSPFQVKVKVKLSAKWEVM